MQRHNDAQPRGVPLGGVGAGCIEMGRDGRIRNVTINNNRSAETRIPLADKAFIAVRAATGDRTEARILQTGSSIPFADAGINAPFVPDDELEWVGLYPCSTYRLRSGQFPLALSWRALSPILPYDTEAATLPLVLFSLQLRNTSHETLNVSALINWENIRGCTALTQPQYRGATRVVALTENEELITRPMDADPTVHGADLGLVFGLGEDVETNADGDYSLLAATTAEQNATHMTWDCQSHEDLKTFWWSFCDKGALPNTHNSDPNAHCGAVCLQQEIAPGSIARISFIFAWHCPRFVVGEKDIGNAYTMTYANSVAVAEYGLRHHKYFLKAVEDWHQRFLNSSLPKWFSRMLLNSLSDLSTNALLSKDGEFAMVESPHDSRTGLLEHRFYSSLATLLLFPSYADSELDLMLNAWEDDSSTDLPRHLGHGTMREPRPTDGAVQSLELHAKIILCATRNYRMTGTLARLIDAYPKLREVARIAINADQDGDGLPDSASDDDSGSGAYSVSGAQAPPLNCYVAGLWVAAWRAMAYLAQQLKYAREGEHFMLLARKAADSFEQRFWNEELRAYPLGADTAHNPQDLSELISVAQQLDGLWYLDFLQLEPALHPTKHYRAATETMLTMLAQPDHPLREHARWGAAESPHRGDSDQRSPAMNSFFSCVTIAYGSTDTALSLLEAEYNRHFADFERGAGEGTHRPHPKPAKAEDSTGTIAVWHALFALQGFQLVVADKALFVKPNLPADVFYLDTPIFTPVCLGWLNYQVTQENGYRQTVKVAFDSPIHIRHIQLQVPSEVTNVDLYLQVDGDTNKATCRLVIGENANTLILDLPKPILIQDFVSMSIVEKAPSPLAKTAHEK